MLSKRCQAAAWWLFVQKTTLGRGGIAGCNALLEVLELSQSSNFVVGVQAQLGVQDSGILASGTVGSFLCWNIRTGFGSDRGTAERLSSSGVRANSPLNSRPGGSSVHNRWNSMHRLHRCRAEGPASDIRGRGGVGRIMEGLGIFARSGKLRYGNGLRFDEGYAE
jgi:hypothetical protein